MLVQLETNTNWLDFDIKKWQMKTRCDVVQTAQDAIKSQPILLQLCSHWCLAFWSSNYPISNAHEMFSFKTLWFSLLCLYIVKRCDWEQRWREIRQCVAVGGSWSASEEWGWSWQTFFSTWHGCNVQTHMIDTVIVVLGRSAASLYARLWIVKTLNKILNQKLMKTNTSTVR